MQCNQSCFVSKETKDKQLPEGRLVQQSIIILALSDEFVYEHRENNAYVSQEKTALVKTENFC